MGERVEIWGTKITLKQWFERARPSAFARVLETPMDFTDMSESERQHADEVLAAGARAAQRDAYLRTLGYADSREFAKELRRHAIHHKYSKEYGALLMKHLGL